jgi:2-polyprenyl-6-methoxyphenol hydroxylase-like FAD-dependent oxidoreductase
MENFTILGGGIGGLTLAVALRQAGIRAQVFEAAPALRPAGAGIVLAANAIRGFERLGLAESIAARGRALPYLRVLDRQGAIIMSADATRIGHRHGLHNVAIHRAALHQALLEALEPGQLQTGWRATGWNERPDRSLDVTFENGQQVHTRYLIAADGIHSPIRRRLAPGSLPRYAGYTCWRAVIEAPGIGQADATETWGRAGRFGLVPLDGRRFYWFACVNAPQNDPAMRRMTVDGLRRIFDGYHAPIPAVLDATRDEDLLWNDICDLAPLPRFAYGPIALLGDAAHATTPNLGQGAGQAIEDAVVLAAELARHADGEAAFRAYERRRLRRTHSIVAASRQLGRIAQLRHPWLTVLRDGLFRLIPESVNERRMDVLLQVDFGD